MICNECEIEVRTVISRATKIVVEVFIFECLTSLFALHHVKADCNYHGTCADRKCECQDDYRGQQCQLKMPCEVLVSKWMSFNSRIFSYLINNNDET